ncbi:hypothetical protein [Streptomyces sp. NPDC049916]|uniref:hypothetical protein n=1 Tax=Streptomyces sp. NPDC049916 TaxID=3155156 RepID=UPI003424422B
MTELCQHHTRSADSPYDATIYGYTPCGELKKVTDPAGNIWSTTYDQMGRPVEESDPAKGKHTTVYDDRGQVTSTTDARRTTLVNVYDNLGRRTVSHTDSTTGPLRAKWTYDTVTGAKGQIADRTGRKWPRPGRRCSRTPARHLPAPPSRCRGGTALGPRVTAIPDHRRLPGDEGPGRRRLRPDR